MNGAGVSVSFRQRYWSDEPARTALRIIRPEVSKGLSRTPTESAMPDCTSNTSTTQLKCGAGAPYGIACDAVGNLYVTDYGNCTIRKITWNH